MAVVVGLWNPEPKYRGTRHNVGAEVIECLCEQWFAPFERAPSRVTAQIATTRIDDKQVILGLPKASMNLSGPPVQSILSFFKQLPGSTNIRKTFHCWQGKLRQRKSNIRCYFYLV